MQSTENNTLSNGGDSQEGTDEELFAIIDETGEGFGFDLTPEALAKPLALGATALFGFGMLAGIPFGLAIGRAQEDGKGIKSAKIRPTVESVKFAATAFGMGTLLCGVMGVTGFFGLKWYYNAETFEDFGNAMRQAVPVRRGEMERGLKPILDKVRKNAGDSLPGPMRKMQERFNQSRFGLWLKEQVDLSVMLDRESEPPSPSNVNDSKSDSHDSSVRNE